MEYYPAIIRDVSLVASDSTPVILATWKTEIRRIEVQLQQIVQETPISKITGAKWTCGVAQALECLLCKVQSSEFKFQSYQKKDVNYIYILPFCPQFSRFVCLFVLTVG
jgi:hypothetical protein